MTSFQDVFSAISHGDFTNEQLNKIIEAIKYRRSQIGKDAKRGLVIGDVVKFVHPKTGRTHIGSVTRVKIKNIRVLEGNSLGNVPANMLTAA